MVIPNILNNKELDHIYSADFWFVYFINRKNNLLFIWDDFYKSCNQDINYYLCFRYPSDILENRIEQIKKSFRQDWIQNDCYKYEHSYFVVNFNIRDTVFIKIKINQNDFKTKIEKHLL